MFRPGDVKDSLVRRVRKLLSTIRRKVKNRGSATLVPIFRTAIEQENLRFQTGWNTRAKAVAFAGRRIRGHLVTDGKSGFRKNTQVIGCPKSFIEWAKGCTAHSDEHGVNRLPALLVCSETFINELPIEPSSL